MLPAVIQQHAQSDPRRTAILDVVRGIPVGSVAGYGQIARRAGLPGRARWVARVLAEAGDPDLPWHRVLRSDGRIAFELGSAGFLEQRRRLLAEGVAVSADGRTRQPAQPDLDALLWGPGTR